jgi:hypothetical protein
METSTEFVVAPAAAEGFYEMANLFPKHTGLPFVVWISYKYGVRHDVRVKVSPGPKALASEITAVAIRPQVHVVEGKMKASDLALLTKWIDLNHDVILRYWEGEIDTHDVVAALKPID